MKLTEKKLRSVIRKELQQIQEAKDETTTLDYMTFKRGVEGSSFNQMIVENQTITFREVTSAVTTVYEVKANNIKGEKGEFRNVVVNKVSKRKGKGKFASLDNVLITTKKDQKFQATNPTYIRKKRFASRYK
jgi:hypothetical protein